ncbi:Eco57I restriction-modification methylase domain-containing protein [Pseudomonas sp. zfem005]|uniref:Eco57I restriction-modification methylase domain-containing protein n=1 Tax=Pseudomonas sp. zfem005 TaxID=3078200 RepID=UPI0029285645|nr:Eco57I restriction-modification methylase domain-containing protein [Pseudomonas sp. zfem005]MDU9414994.1 Eco57I restriction-modification methylase domain-containing protein [Pseudomonas sp. zfem005]
MLEQAEVVRREITPKISRAYKEELGQFLTPSDIARFMASLFSEESLAQCNILDAGAGVGALSCALLDRLPKKKELDVSVTAVEVDSALIPHLSQHLGGYKGCSMTIIQEDFIEFAARKITFEPYETFTHAILNPPYKKIHSTSKHRKLLRTAGIETVNLYSAFVALSLKLMKPGAIVVALIPRSFCSGPYYKKFRDLILEESSIQHIHLFNSRTKAFKDYNVQQENVIIVLQKKGTQRKVRITTSTDEKLSDLTDNLLDFDEIVQPSDKEKYIHIPTRELIITEEQLSKIIHSPEDLGFQVSTGPVVDFRVKKYLTNENRENSAPLIHPINLRDHEVQWPITDTKRPSNIEIEKDTLRQLLPMGYYCVVKRFSPKEQEQRIVASTINPANFPDHEKIGIENHLNVLHHNKQGLDAEFAMGLTAYLNSSIANLIFKKFSGHTQVNAEDLRKLKYPSAEALRELGSWIRNHPSPSQNEIDTTLLNL